MQLIVIKLSINLLGLGLLNHLVFKMSQNSDHCLSPEFKMKDSLFTQFQR